MRRNSRAARPMASSQVASSHGSVVFFRTSGVVIRSGCVAYPKAKRPLTQAWPWFAWPFRLGTIRTTLWPLTSALNEQPTPQYAQVVVTTRVGGPIWISDFSVSATVGQASTHAPHETHSDC